MIHIYDADVPYLELNVKNLELYVPFKHTLEFYTKSRDYPHWTFEDLDPKEFTSDMTFVRDWEFIIALDRSYNHGTMLCSLNRTIHGNRFSVHTKKNYHFSQGTAEINIRNDGIQYNLLHDADSIIENLRQRYPERFTIQTNKMIKPEGRISEYTMNCLKYTHS